VSPARPLTREDLLYLERHRVAHLATADSAGRPHVVPVCFVVDGDAIYIPIDLKPKRVGPAQLKRIRNIEERPDVSIVVDNYNEDWEQLSYLMIRGVAELRPPAAAEHAAVVALLRSKYPQYLAMPLEERPIIRILPTSAVRWAWRGWPAT
jgi:PPOX class probable F420-dependent enzyme